MPPYRDFSPDEEEAYIRFVATGVPRRLIDKGRRLRAIVPRFLEQCAQLIGATGAGVVGFTTTFNQSTPSLVLSKILKDRYPRIAIVFGGANCDGPMGPALHRAFPWIDYVVRGEAEYALPQLLEAIEGKRDPHGIAGLCFREAGASVSNPAGPEAAVRMADVPAPNYDEYFERLREHRIGSAIESGSLLPVESSRGCWWGEKHHCTFCGLNGMTLAFRSKAADAFALEIVELSKKYKKTRFQAVDNILDTRYFKEFLPRLKAARDAGEDYFFFYEVKANMRREQVRQLAEAGVIQIQPGIESLSTPILRLMRKGVTALQNIRLLKWAREYGIAVVWNLLWGFPGESDAEYEHMFELIPSITHLEPPPGVSRLLLERFSPHFEEAERFGIRIRGPAMWYRHIYPVTGTDLYDIAYDFEYDVPERERNGAVAKVEQRIRTMWTRQQYATGVLSYGRGNGFITIKDRRIGLERCDAVLSGVTAAIYLSCDAGISVPMLLEKFPQVAEADLRRLLATLTKRRFLYEEDGLYLSLALAERPTEGFDLEAASPLVAGRANALEIA